MIPKEGRSVRWYRTLLRLYPAAFRRRHQQEMLAWHREAERETRASGGRTGLLVFWSGQIGDVIWNASAETWHSLFSSPLSAPQHKAAMWLGFTQDIRFAWRMLLFGNRAVTAAALVVLTLPIAGVAALLGIAQVSLFAALPFSEPDRLVQIWETDLRRDVTRGIVAPANYFDWLEGGRAFERMVPWRFWFFNVADAHHVERVQGLQVGWDFFELLGVRAEHGRTFVPDDELSSPGTVAVLSHGFWLRAFGGNPAVIGRDITIDGRRARIIGILGTGFRFFHVLDRPLDVWVPLGLRRHSSTRDDHSINVYGRLRPWISVDQAQNELAGIAKRLATVHPKTNANRGVHVEALMDVGRETTRPALRALGVALAVVLLIACANIANLLLSRSIGRRTEIATRMALGATRWRVIRQLLIENVLIALVAASTGIALAAWAMPVLDRLLPHSAISRFERFHLDIVSMSMTALCVVGTTVLSGLVPALKASSVLVRRPRAYYSPATDIRPALVVAEITLAVSLTTAAMLLTRSALAVSHYDRGFQTQNVITMQVWLPASKYRTPEQIAHFFDELVERTGSATGMDSIGAMNFAPGSGLWDEVSVAIDGRSRAAAASESTLRYHIITPGVLRTVGLRLIKGRNFTSSDGRHSNVVLVSESAAQTLWPDEDPLGKQLRPVFPDASAPWRPVATDRWLTVVGVVADTREEGLVRAPQRRTLYLPHAQNPSLLMSILAKTTADPYSVAEVITREIGSIDAQQPVFDVKLLSNVRTEMSARRELVTSLTSAFALLGMVLAVTGVYSVVACYVVSRRRELGIRLALGAGPASIMRLVLSRGARWTAVGALLGICGSLVTGRTIQAYLFEIAPTDLATIFLSTIGFIAVVLVACAVSARSAIGHDLVSAFREEYE